MRTTLGVAIVALLVVPAHAQFGQKIHYFPQFAVGDVAESHFTVSNPGTQPISVGIELFLSDGTAFASRQILVPPRGYVTEVFADPDGDAQNGWAKLSSSDQSPFTASLFYRIQGVGNVGVAPSVPVRQLRVVSFGEGSGVAVANPGQETVTLNYLGVGLDGVVSVSGALTPLAPGEHQAFFIREHLGITADVLLEFEATAPVVVVALRVQDSLLAGVPVAIPRLAIRSEPHEVSPNIIGGDDSNSVVDGVFGATISGGGSVAENLENPCFILGSECNNRVIAGFGAIGGGAGNRAGSFSHVGGGLLNAAEGYASGVGGGESNTSNGLFSVIGGGQFNEASGNYSSVPGGFLNTALGEFSVATGRRAKAIGKGTFVFADSTDEDFGSFFPDSFWVRASGGTRIYSNPDLTSGVQLQPGSSSWSTLSDRSSKENFASAKGQTVLRRLASIPISTWNYKTQEEQIRHMGPMAQDFYAAFGLGEDKRRISTVDADGVALAAIQGLYQMLLAKDQEIEALKRDISEIREMIDRR